MTIKDPQEDDATYMPGTENVLLRYYFYLNNGLNVLNQFRNLFLGIFALYFALKLENWGFLIVFFLISAILLTVVGYYATHKVNKLMEWLSIRFSTHYSRQQYDNTQRILETLEEISTKLTRDA